MKSIHLKRNFKILGVLLFLYMGVSYKHGQSYDHSMLIKKEWKQYNYNKSFNFIFYFTGKEELVRGLEKGVKSKVVTRCSYYLSDKIVDTFQPELVGKIDKGRYIVVYRKPLIGEEFIDIYEILELTEKSLKLKHLKSGVLLDYVLLKNK